MLNALCKAVAHSAIARTTYMCKHKEDGLQHMDHMLLQIRPNKWIWTICCSCYGPQIKGKAWNIARSGPILNQIE